MPWFFNPGCLHLGGGVRQETGKLLTGSSFSLTYGVFAFIALCDNSVDINTLCSKKSDAKIQITVTTAYLIRINLPLATLIIAYLAQTLQISTKSTTWFLSNSVLKNGT